MKRDARMGVSKSNTLSKIVKFLKVIKYPIIDFCRCSQTLLSQARVS